MNLRDRIQLFFEGTGNTTTSSKIGTFCILAVLLVMGGWVGYSLFFMPQYKKEFKPTPAAYTTANVRDLPVPKEEPPKVVEPRKLQGEPRKVEPVKETKKPRQETDEEKYRRMARLHAHYAGPFDQAWRQLAGNTNSAAQDSDTKPGQTLEVPPVQQARAETRQPGFLQPPQSPYMVMRGSVIPVVLMDGFDTQVEGQITARVVRDVMDTRTGRHVMIPQDSWVNGHYDINLPYDQDRVPTGWDELVLPSGETMDLQNFSGADTNGAAGTPVDVDTHFWRTAGRSLLLTITGAAAGVARHGAYENGDYTGADALADHGGRQMDRRSRELWDRGGYRGPTGKAKKGEVFLLQVTQSMTFPGDYYQRQKGGMYAFAE